MKHRISLPDWAAERGAASNSFAIIDPARTAFVAIDMQAAFLGRGQVFGNPYAQGIIGPLNALAGAMRAAGAPVVWTRMSVSDDPPLALPRWQRDTSDPVVARAVADLRPGQAGHALDGALDVAAADVVLDKYRYGAFACPAGALGSLLEERNIEMLVLAGTLTNVCVESTAREAYLRGYKVIVASDATAARTDEEHNASLLNLGLAFANVKTVEEILALV